MERANSDPGLVEPVQPAVMRRTQLLETYSLCRCGREVGVPEASRMRKWRIVVMDVLERSPQEGPREHER
jgi:hypothetical protein